MIALRLQTISRRTWPGRSGTDRALPTFDELPSVPAPRERELAGVGGGAVDRL